MIKRDITTNSNEIQRIIREYFENLYSSKLENLKEIEKFLDAFNQPQLRKKKDINHLNRSITNNEIKAVIKSVLTKNNSVPDGFMLNSTKPLKKN
jgi:glutamyl-tRNA reductase